MFAGMPFETFLRELSMSYNVIKRSIIYIGSIHISLTD